MFKINWCLLIILLASCNACGKKINFEWTLKNGNVKTIVTVDKTDLYDFLDIYKKRPLKTNIGGMGIIAMFWVWFATKHIKPDLIIESGIWKGQSTWLLEQAAPNARIISIDPSLHFREYISPKVEYVSDDFGSLNFGDISNIETLCFFDDHQDAFLRVKQAKEKGFKHLLFDDNYPAGMGGHYSLTHCLTEASHHAHHLISLIHDLVIFPHLSSDKITTHQGQKFPTDQLNLTYDSNLQMYWDKNEQNRYRWTTYVAL